MRKALLITAASLSAGLLATRLGESKILAELENTPPPDWWKTPRFPDGTELKVQTDDHAEIHVATAGDTSAPPVVLIHGITQNHHDLGLVAERLLESGFHVVGIDQRGHGDSTVGTDGFSAHRLGLDLGQVLTHLDLNGVVLGGHSMGGIAIQAMLVGAATDLTDRVKAVVLVATTPRLDQPHHRLITRIFGSRLYTWSKNHPVHGPAFGRIAFGRKASMAQVGAVMDSSRRCPAASERGAARGLGDYDVVDQLADTAVRATVVYGTHDAVTFPSDNALIARRLGARPVVLEGIGHSIPQEDPEAMAEAICQAHTVAG
ncbi:MAG: alpha/beta hydrolase [Actinomycetia bacterium]|nr:alpha/beta hydrolase [Actinomycetes bacterium]MCP4958101.1 alpha/beta hydrolase [Actinomycetes bacterium]